MRLLDCLVVSAVMCGSAFALTPEERAQKAQEQRRMNELRVLMKDEAAGASIMHGQYAEAEKAFDAYWPLAKKYGVASCLRERNASWGFPPLLVGRDAKWALHKYDELVRICEEGLALSEKAQKKDLLSAADVYELKLTAAIAPLKGTAESVATTLTKIEPPLAAGLSGAERADRLKKCASVANAANDEHLVRGILRYLERVSPTVPKKTYAVGYSATPVDGPSAWCGIKAKSALMDRNYGGFTDVFVTDVASGERGASAEAATSRPTMWAACDDWGVHFKFADPDEKAREMYLGAVNSRTYEIYIAPGPNEPYVMLTVAACGKRLDAMNMAYDHAGFRRFDAKNPDHFRRVSIFDGKALVTCVSFSWDVWPTHVPTADSVWDFEVVRWGRTGNAAWNGLRRVHGRSTWGQLTFDLAPGERAAILRRQLLRAKSAFQMERLSWYDDRGGVIDKWRDAEMGDPRFYETCVLPYADTLEKSVEAVTPEMDDKTALGLGETLLPELVNFRHTISSKRVAYLKAALPRTR